jgi:Raf kinase inhibitor-like YbhB/YbcL family protein
MTKRVCLCLFSLASFLALAACGGGGGHVPSARFAQSGANANFAALTQFTVSSTTFSNNGRVPLSMVENQFGCHGGNRSPQLSWARAPIGTRSFAVVTFDQTANFGHWGIYNISAATTSLPENTGASSALGIEVNNDFGTRGYGGPCPPPGLNHRYVFTVYALDGSLYISSSAQFPSNVEALLWSMEGHVLGKAVITGFFST